MIAMLNPLHNLLHFISGGIKSIKVLIWNSVTIAFLGKWAQNSN